ALLVAHDSQGQEAIRTAETLKQLGEGPSDVLLGDWLSSQLAAVQGQQLADHVRHSRGGGRRGQQEPIELPTDNRVLRAGSPEVRLILYVEYFGGDIDLRIEAAQIERHEGGALIRGVAHRV